MITQVTHTAHPTISVLPNSLCVCVCDVFFFFGTLRIILIHVPDSACDYDHIDSDPGPDDTSHSGIPGHPELMTSK